VIPCTWAEAAVAGRSIADAATTMLTANLRVDRMNHSSLDRRRVLRLSIDDGYYGRAQSAVHPDGSTLEAVRHSVGTTFISDG
jgi:hypothetical protein